MKKRRRALVLCGLLGTLAFAAACSKTKPTDPRYRPTESVLEVVSVLRKHIPDDTYRFEPARDFTGRNVYRASLLRLENLERVYDTSFRSGAFDDVIAFSKGRALERIRAYDLASFQYREAANIDGPLRQDALRSAALCDALHESSTLVPTPPSDETPTGAARQAAMAAFEAREKLLGVMLQDARGTHYEAVLFEELERTDMDRARFLVSSRRLTEDGDVRALAALQGVVSEHRESKNTNLHLLSLADLYAELAAEYIEHYPPESLGFDPARFEELVEAAARIYEAISNQDGAAEKLEAARRLEAFLAFTLTVDRDRFSP